ncbi:MAG: hypothetical protein KF845_08420 [Cyclobacteriaceae bacterium]|nr:hypothetical protein [Cyclobacteriaceae bacterium]
MIKQVVGFLVVFVIAHTTNAGELKTDSIPVQTSRYYNSFYAGAMVGCGLCYEGKDFTLSLLTMHGLRVSPGVKLGLGVGMDVYTDWRLFPLVAGVTFDKERRRNAMYLSINGGHAWGRYLLPDTSWWVSDFTGRGGFVFNPMLGYRIGNERMRIYVQAGYKHQLAYTKSENIGAWGGNTFTREYELNRFVFQMGFGFR